MRNLTTRAVLACACLCLIGTSARSSAGRTFEPWPALRVSRPVALIAPPLVIERVERPTFVREVVSSQWRAGDPVTLYVVLPKAVPRPRAALFLYSHPQDAARFLDDGFCERVAGTGIAAVGFESALTGERYRARPMREWFVSELPEAIGKTVHDVQHILDYLRTRNDLETQAFGMFGQGSGGSIALLAGAVDPRIRAIEAVNPWGDWPRWIAGTPLVPEAERRALARPEWLRAVTSVEPFTKARMNLLSDRSLRLTLVGQDAHLPAPALETLLKVRPSNAQVRRFEDAGAYYRSFVGGSAFSWISDSLRSAR